MKKLPKFSFDKLINAISGRCWNFHVTFKYELNPGVANTAFVSNSMTISTTDRNLLASHRNLKKMLVPDMVKNLPKHLRSNGKLYIEQITYIGWYKPKAPDPVQTRRLGHKKRFGQLL